MKSPIKLKRIGSPQAAATFGEWEGYVTADGKLVVIRDYEITGCDCPDQLCPHADHEREEYGWYIFPNTEAGAQLGLADAYGGRFATVREARLALAEWAK